MEEPKRGTFDFSASEAPAKGRSYFLGIGVDAYEHFPTLANARKDVEDLRDLLTQHYYFEAAHTTLLCGAQASRKNILRQLNEYRKTAAPDDRLLIYYAGHGLFDGDLGFWIPAEAERDDTSGYVSNADLREIVRSIPARHILLISDSCFSASLMVRDASRGPGGAFEDFERNPSRWIFISGKGVVSDGQPGHNSPFAAAILKHLRQNPTEALNIAHLADQVTKEVRFNYEQQAEASPLYQAGHAGGQFVFLKRQTERDAWQRAQHAGTEGAFLAFLRQYPDSAHAQEAEARLSELADEKAWHSASLKDSAFEYRQYLKKYPNGQHAAEARDKLADYEAEEQARQETLQQQEAARIEQERQALLKKQEADKTAREKQALLEKQAEEQARQTALQQQEAARRTQERQTLLKEQAERERQAALQQQADERQVLLKQATEARQKNVPPPPPSFLKRHALVLGSGSAILAALLIWQLSQGPEKPREEVKKVLHDKTLPQPTDQKQPQTTFHPTNTGNNNTPAENKPSNKEIATKAAAKEDNTRNKLPKQASPTQQAGKTEPKTNNNPPKEDPKPSVPSFDRAKVLNQIQTALAGLTAEEFDDTKKAINTALSVNQLPPAVQADLKSAKAYLSAEEYANARAALQAAKSKCGQ